MIMITWVFGIRTDFRVNPGKAGKYLKEFLAPTMWSHLLETYTGADPSDTWKGLVKMCDIFRECAHEVAHKFGFEYPEQDDSRVTQYFLKIFEE